MNENQNRKLKYHLNHLYIFFFLYFICTQCPSPFTGRLCFLFFFKLQLLRKAWISPDLLLVPEPVPRPEIRGHRQPVCLQTGGIICLQTVSCESPAHRTQSHECALSWITPPSTSSVRWVCLSLAWRRPRAQSCSSPELTSSCPTCLRVSRRSTRPRRRWPPGRPRGQTWRWWWSGWGQASLACCLQGSGCYPQSLDILCFPELERKQGAEEKKKSEKINYKRLECTTNLMCERTYWFH